MAIDSQLDYCNSQAAYERMQYERMAAMRNAQMMGGIGIGLQQAGIGSTSCMPKAEKPDTIILLTDEEI